MSQFRAHRGSDTGAVPRISPTIADIVTQVFDRVDRDADGALSRAEILTALDPKGRGVGAADTVDALLEVLDDDGSGSVSGSELTAALNARDANGDGSLNRDDGLPNDEPDLLGVLLHEGRGGPRGGPGGVAGPGGHGAHGALPSITVDAAVLSVFERFDIDASGTIPVGELLAVLDPQGTRVRLADQVGDDFAVLDEDASGSLDAAEVEAAVAALDADGNGMLDIADRDPGQPCDVVLIGMLLHAAELG